VTGQVLAVLEAAKSSFLEHFDNLAQRIKDGSVEANNNLKFLESIHEPCELLVCSTKSWNVP
jgi:dynein heavy chain, axonemal